MPTITSLRCRIQSDCFITRLRAHPAIGETGKLQRLPGQHLSLYLPGLSLGEPLLRVLFCLWTFLSIWYQLCLWIQPCVTVNMSLACSETSIPGINTRPKLSVWINIQSLDWTVWWGQPCLHWRCRQPSCHNETVLRTCLGMGPPPSSKKQNLTGCCSGVSSGPAPHLILALTLKWTHILAIVTELSLRWVFFWVGSTVMAVGYMEKQGCPFQVSHLRIRVWKVVCLKSTV